jgi:hypothetical protein
MCPFIPVSDVGFEATNGGFSGVILDQFVLIYVGASLELTTGDLPKGTEEE